MTPCPECKTPVTLEDKFCGRCGAKLQTDSSGTFSLTQHELNATDVKFRLAGVYFKKGNTKAVIGMCRQVLEVDPNHQEALMMLRQAEQSQSEDRDT
jgi:hypothetical protein